MKKREKRQNDGWNQEKFRTLGEKEILKYLGILENGTPSNQAEMKEKIKKNTSGEEEKYWRPNCVVETASKA